MKSFRYAYFALLFAILLTPTASAYIDPSTTAILTQVVVGALISLGLVFGIFKQKIIMFFKNMKIKRIQGKIEKENQKSDI
ncbi:MAG: hypothetical protein FWF82_05670 [Oscillospiraceae bacterium]|nr:hypothetical protein [Oscillospiraceae bacterium]